MTRFLTRVIIYAIAIFLVFYLFHLIRIDSTAAWIGATLVLAILNALVKPFLILITLPLNILTLGLFTLVINATLLSLTAMLVSGFEIDGFWRAVLASFLITIIAAIFNTLLGDRQHIQIRIHRGDRT